MYRYLSCLALALLIPCAHAAGLGSLSNADAASGLKEALVQAAESAVGKLSAVDGFLGNADVRIPLPDSLQKVEKGMRMFGMGKQADELVLKMNRAAEAAVPEARAADRFGQADERGRRQEHSDRGR